VNVTIDEWLTNLRARINESAAKVAIDLAGWMRSHGELFTTAAKTPALAMSVLENGHVRYPFSISPAGKANIALCYLAYSEAYRDPDSLRSLVQKTAPALGLDPKKINLGGILGIKLDELAVDYGKYNTLTQTLAEIVQRLTTSSGATTR